MKIVKLRNRNNEEVIPEGISKLINYSSEETIIGTWEGKPLYRKVYTTYTEETDSNVRYLIIDTDITKETIDFYGSLNMLGTLLTFPTPDIGFGIIGGINKNGSGQLYMTLSNKDIAISNFKCVLLYTKTTD